MADTPIYGLGICAGALGLELGIETAIPGYRTVCVVEREIAVCGRVAALMAEGSIAPLACWDDVTTFNGKPWRGIVSIISAGFPCQPFSVAGKRAGTSDARWIWPDIARVIGEVEPELVFLENVPGLLLDPDSDSDRWEMEEQPDDTLGGMGTVLRDLAQLGFNAEWLCLRASDVGASHGRKRVFILAYRQDFNRWSEFEPGEQAGDGRRGLAGIRGAVGQSGSTRHQERGDSLGVREQPATERTGSELGGTESGRLGIGGEPSSSVGLPDGTDATLGDPRRRDTGRIQSQLERERSEPATIENSGRELDVSISGRLEGPNLHLRQSRPDETEVSAGGSGDGLPIFAPGPSDPIWEDVLLRRPWLRPSWAQAEAQSHFRNLVDGLAPLLAAERTTAIRTLGNGVVPLQAAAAFRILARRAREILSANR